jgi:type II secretory pathway component PulF
MPAFRYQGFDMAGGRVEGTIDAESSERALRDLRERGFLVSKLRAADAGGDWRASLGL